jgi:pyruvate dehydrogenase E2 component (dihydrolipoamide acetyltransferase)
MVVKACALALREHPRANSSYRDGRVQLHGRVNVGVAVAVDAEEHGGDGERAQGAGHASATESASTPGRAGGALIVPTVFDADTKALGEIARETRALAARVREGVITPPELGGGTFTVSNLGMFGVDAFTAIVNPPQAAILAVGAVRARPVVIDGGDGTGEIASRPTMAATLACDHRVLYGADAARFLARVRELLEQPAALTL